MASEPLDVTAVAAPGQSEHVEKLGSDSVARVLVHVRKVPEVGIHDLMEHYELSLMCAGGSHFVWAHLPPLEPLKNCAACLRGSKCRGPLRRCGDEKRGIVTIVWRS